MNTTEILQNYLAQHRTLGRQVDAPNKEAFDVKHRQLWHSCDVELWQRRVELEQAGSLTEEEEEELRELKVRVETEPSE